METDLKIDANTEKLHAHWKTLQIMETELDDLYNVPLAYMQEFYSLRLHIEFVERRLIRKMRVNENAGEVSETTSSSPTGTQSESDSDSRATILCKTEETIAIDSTVSFAQGEIESPETPPERSDPPSKDQA